MKEIIVAKLRNPMLISVGAKLTEIDGDTRVLVREVTKDDIAWFKKVPEGGVFGECSRTMAHKLFKNVATCQIGKAC
jgi:hypothetical protein